MKSLLTLALLITFSLASYAGSEKYVSMKGSIENWDKEALAGAQIEIIETASKVYSDFDGKFSIENLKPGIYSLKVTLVSYQELEVKLQVSGDYDYKLQLNPR